MSVRGLELDGSIVTTWYTDIQRVSRVNDLFVVKEVTNRPLRSRYRKVGGAAAESAGSPSATLASSRVDVTASNTG